MCCGSARIAAACALIACNQAQQAPEQAAVSRVVLITIDTLRADHVSAYGEGRARTPNLDRLAKRGVRFQEAIAPSPMTQPSHATLFTGLDPPRHGLRSNGTAPLSDEATTLAERMRDAGFATAGFIGAVILESHYGFAQGFDRFGDRMETEQADELRGLDARRADAVVDEALAWLAQAPARFFLWVHVYDPHAPYDAPRTLRGLLGATPYAAEVVYADAQLGRLLDAVDARWPDGGTLVAVTSDHGESLGEHGEDTHAYSVYDATQRVPLILAGAGVPAGRVVESQVRLADLAPTLLARAEVAPLPGVDGADLTPLWSGANVESRPALVETIATRLHFGWSPVFGVRSDGYKYLRAPRLELYDLTADPGETENLAEGDLERVAALDALLTRLLHDERSVSSSELDPMRRAQLERLGYLVSAAPGSDDALRVGGPDPKDHLHELTTFREATAHLRHGRPVQALKALQGLPASTFISTLRADAALAAGRPRLAERHARRALVGGAGDANVHVTLGNAVLSLGRVDEAESAFTRAAELHPASSEVWVGLGLVAERRGDTARAMEMYGRATQTRVASTEARWLLAALLLEQRRDDEAQAWLAPLPRELLERPMVATRLSDAEARCGRRDAARARLDRAARRWPDDPLLKRARAQLDRETAAP